MSSPCHFSSRHRSLRGVPQPLRSAPGPVFRMLPQGNPGLAAAGGGENLAGNGVRPILKTFATTPYRHNTNTPTLVPHTIFLSLKNIGRPHREEEVDLRRRRGWTRGWGHLEMLLCLLLRHRPQKHRGAGGVAQTPRPRPTLSGVKRGRGPRLLKRYVTHRTPWWGGGVDFCAVSGA